MKAFLSHSSKDAQFVHAVAEELGRQFTWLDRQKFDTGDEFLAAMEAGLADSSVFVLFASKHSLASTFVDFEITEARQQLLARSLDRVLVFLIDPSVSHRDLPLWLQRFQATTANAPRPIARAIRFALDSQARARQRALFVGRSRELSTLEDRLLPADGSPPPRVMLISGLPGIGRKTLAERVARDHWSLARAVEVRVEPADDLADIAIKLSDRFEPYSTVEAFRAIAERIRSETADKLPERIAAYLRAAVGTKELPIFVDAGGLLTNDAEPSAIMMALLSIHRGQRDLYSALVSSRRPRDTELPARGVASVAVQPLSSVETRQLISALGARDQLTLGPDLITALAEAAAGYPPSCYHTIELVKNYGPDVALGDANRLVSSRLGPLTRYLKALSLEDVDKHALRVLATNSPLPFSVLGAVLDTRPEDLAVAMSRLIDGCLVVPGEESSYRLAEPVVDVVIRELGEPTKNDYASVVEALDSFLKRDVSDTPKLEYARVLYRAYLLADEAAYGDTAFALTSDLLSAAERMYHRRDYRRAIEYASQVLEYRPRNYDARYTLVRALIKANDIGRAGEQIETLRRAGYLREAAFLDGFLKRHGGRHREAIEAYRTALQRGYGGLAIHRELAQCYLSLGQIDDAKEHIKRAARMNRDNPYVIDLQVQIATKERDEEAAVQGLALLEALDEPEFYHHRRSKVLATFGKSEEALRAARQALEEAGRPTFAMLSQIVVCEIRLGHLQEAAEHIAKIERDFANQNHDVRVGLRVQLEIGARRFDDALTLWDEMSDRSLPVHLALRRSAIAGLLSGALTDERRITLTDELAELKERLAGCGDVEFEVPDESPVDE